MTFNTHTILEIFATLQAKLLTQRGVSFKVVNPDIFEHMYAGTEVVVKGVTYLYRGYKSYVDLAEQLGCKLLTPKLLDGSLVELSFKKLQSNDSFHRSTTMIKEEKYGINSPFFQLNKMEEPAFVLPLTQALKKAQITKKTRVLNLGINKGDEFALIERLLEQHSALSYVGIDHSDSIIDYAKKRFKGDNFTFYAHDINDLDRLNLGRFDFIMSIGTLQSPSINFKPFFQKLVQNYLTKEGSLVLGFPNCRWIDGEYIFGAKAPNYAYNEYTILYNDVQFCKKYLQQKKFRVTVTGKPYIFVTATPLKIRNQNE